MCLIQSRVCSFDDRRNHRPHVVSQPNLSLSLSPAHLILSLSPYVYLPKDRANTCRRVQLLYATSSLCTSFGGCLPNAQRTLRALLHRSGSAKELVKSRKSLTKTNTNNSLQRSKNIFFMKKSVPPYTLEASECISMDSMASNFYFNLLQK